MALQGVVEPHTTSVVVWDVPPAVATGQPFRLKVGIKCSGDCPLRNEPIEIRNHQGEPVATGILGDIWTGTNGLYFAEVELQAPEQEGLYTWTAQSLAPKAALPHPEGSITFGVRVVGRPEYVVKVATVDQVTQAPLQGAAVVMPPYRASTDARGVARLRVAKGAYTLFVSHARYLTFGLPVEVTSNRTARAELVLEPQRERN